MSDGLDSSRYAIEGELGRGGMGRVFSGRDLRLGRPVAIKVLPEELASDPERVRRLQREARALAKVHHPNIAIIYSLEISHRGTRLLILEHVEGETLRSRLRRGALPVPEALRIGVQIAAALESAHERGVVHRDLKPANVMITPDGIVKVLDFGLAKITTEEPPGERSEEIDTTRSGHAVGTPGYMSPEQLRGHPADPRADLFSFGCLFYECLAGAKAFGGDATEASLAILTRDPVWSLLPPEIPPDVRDLVVRCLRKEPDERPDGMGEVRSILEAALGGPLPAGARTERVRAKLHNLPEPLTSFIGRERELERASSLLRESRLLTLTGTGGSGKTRLALRLGEIHLPDFADGVWLADLAPVSDAERVPATVASALQLRERAGDRILDTISEHIGARSILLILDNCEHLLPACTGLVKAILPRAPLVRILATSREPLHVPGEQILSVPPLATLPRARAASTGSGAPPAPSEAARLFFDRATTIRPDLSPAGRDLETAEEICRGLEGLPLAVELAAARVRVLTLAEIRTKLANPIRLLAGGAALEPRHQALARAIGWSYDLLTEEERAFFRSLAVFSGGWTLESALEVSGRGGDEFDALNLLSRLTDKSLVLTEPGGGDRLRFRLLETVRRYALERLREAGEEEAIRARHRDCFLAMAERAGPELVGPEQALWLTRLEAEHENMLTALWWCRRGAGGERAALRMAGALWRFWFGRGHLELGRTVIKAVLSLPGAAARTRERAEALLGAGALAFHQNDFPGGIAAYREALETFREHGDERGAAFALGGLGNVYMGNGDYGEARANYEEALALLERTGHRRGMGAMWSNLGRVAELEGDLERAHALSERGIVVFREVGDLGSLALRLSSLAELSLRLGERGRAREQLLECLKVVQELGEPHPAAYALERAAAWLAATGQPAPAARLCGAADCLRRRIASPRAPKEKRDLDVLLLRIQSTLGGAAFGSAWAEGRELPSERALAEARRALEASEGREVGGSEQPGR